MGKEGKGETGERKQSGGGRKDDGQTGRMVL